MISLVPNSSHCLIFIKYLLFPIPGITNGAHWYPVAGGMQDFNYLKSNAFEITVEVSCCKFPYANKLKHFWEANKPALLAYLDQVHTGIKGYVKSDSGEGRSLIMYENVLFCVTEWKFNILKENKPFIIIVHHSHF